MIRAEADAPTLAVALANALAFLPARSRIRYAAIRLTPEGVYTSGTDSYAAGTDYAPVTGFIGSHTSMTVLVDKEGLTELERCAREAKNVRATVEVKADALTVTPVGGYGKTVPTYRHDGTSELHETIAGIIAGAEKRPNAIPGVVCLDPALFGRFTKVKADKFGRKADLLFGDAHDPVLVKIGPTFKGLIMPIDRDVNSKNVGPEGLW